MVTLDVVRAAALADKPWDRLDELVRSEMAVGRKVADIATDFLRVADDVWGTPGISEVAGDAFGDTLDALTGNCGMESSCYKDPPNHALPTEEEIAKLPRWARVAFVARCARRVLPLLDQATLHTAHNKKKWIVSAISLSELAAAQASAVDEVYNQLPEVENAAGWATMDGAFLGTVGAEAAGWVALAAFDANTIATGKEIRLDITEKAARAARAVPSGESSVATHSRRDFDRLTRLAKWLHWTNDTPVPPEVFGPLWPEGPPSGWPADPGVPQRTELPVAFLALERVIPMILEDEAVNVFNALNRYYIARTGDRLTLDGDIHTLVSALVGAGV